jgi:hypothetical protein
MYVCIHTVNTYSKKASVWNSLAYTFAYLSFFIFLFSIFPKCLENWVRQRAMCNWFMFYVFSISQYLCWKMEIFSSENMYTVEPDMHTKIKIRIPVSIITVPISTISNSSRKKISMEFFCLVSYTPLKFTPRPSRLNILRWSLRGRT